MKNIIDKDISLFLPKKYKFLLLGGNFLLSKRLYEITKRQFEIKRIDYDFKNTEEYFPCIDSLGFDIFLEPAKKIQTIIDLHNSNVLVFTSEILLLLNETKFQEFIEVIKDLKKRNIRIVFLSIINPLHICKNKNQEIELTNMMSKSWYISRIVLLQNLLDLSKDLLFQCSSFITYVRSNIQVNIIDLEKTQQNFLTCPEESHFKFPISIADDIISSLINNIELVGHFSYNEQNSRQIQMRFIEDFLKTDYICNYVKTQSLCSVNLIYRKKSSEIERDKSIANWRYDLGKNLGQNLSDVIKNEIDIVIPVPETGKYYAQGLSNILEKPYVEAFYKKTEIGRSFDIADEEKRQNFLDSKLGILSDLVANKVVAIVDEAIFTGQTLKLVKSLLDSASVEKIYFFIASPICSKKCNFNMMPDRKLLSSEYGQDDMVRYFNIQGIIFQDLKSFEDISFDAGFTCTKCFNLYECRKFFN